MNGTREHGQYELRFRSLFDDGRALAFPCDANGHVDLDALSEQARSNYLYPARPSAETSRCRTCCPMRCIELDETHPRVIAAPTPPGNQTDKLRAPGGRRPWRLYLGRAGSPSGR